MTNYRLQRYLLFVIRGRSLVLYLVFADYEILVVDPQLCCDRVVDVTVHRERGNWRSRIPAGLPFLLQRPLFFLDKGAASVRRHVPLRLL
jgi:hypothetical protein